MTRDVLYDSIGSGYAPFRRPDPRLALAIQSALGQPSSIVNVGAGAGSYEPSDCSVFAVEPSRTMIRQRPAGAAQAVCAIAEALPLAGRCVDAALAVFTLHHWADLLTGLKELKRVARQSIVLVTIDPRQLARHWLVAEYVPEAMEHHAATFPSIARLGELLPGARVVSWEIPADCSDMFFVALWARPEAYLDPAVRAATSVWHQLPAGVSDRALERLRVDLESGEWDARHGHLRSLGTLDVGLRLVVADVSGESGRA